MAYTERVKRKLPPKENQYGLIFFPGEGTFSVVNNTKIHDFEDDLNSHFIIIENKTYYIEVLVRGSKEYCEKKAIEFKKYGDILESSDEAQKLRSKFNYERTRSQSPENKRSKSSIIIQSKNILL